MLESMRAVQNTWVGKAVIGLLFLFIIVGLSFFGFADLFRTSTSSSVARVGSTDISVEAYRQAYQSNLQQLQQQLRRPVTNAQARQYGLDQQVLFRLVTDAVLENQAHKLGLAISDPQIAKAITDDPTFANANGQFDHSRFVSLLRDNGLTEQRFVREQRGTYLRQELIDGVVGAMNVPRAALDALHRYQAEVRSIDMIALQPAMLGDLPAPDEATLQKFYDDRKDGFSAPEFRKLVVLDLSPATVAKPADVSDAEIRRAYEADSAGRFGTPERRTLQQIVFPNEAEAQAAALRINAGLSFDAVAAERNVSGKDLDLGTITKDAIFDKAVADAAFALPSGGTSDPVKGTFGTVLVHAVAVEPGSKQSLDEVAPMIRQEIATSSARTGNALRDIRDKIEDHRASGKPLAEAAKASGVEVRTLEAVDSTGHDPSGAVIDLPDRDALLRAAFASDVGVDNDVLQTRQGNQIWFEVAKVDTARQRTFADARTQVEAAWRTDETKKRLVAKADELVKGLDGGMTMEQVSASLGKAEVSHTGDLRRTGAQGVPQSVTVKAFDTTVGKAGSAEGAEGGRIIFKVIDSIVPPLDADAPETKQIENKYRNMFADDLMNAYLARIEGGLTVKINSELVNSVVGGAS